MFKAKSNRRFKNVVCPIGVNLTLQWAEKGSYRMDNLKSYLERWLDPWTPERAAAFDWRILLLDVAASHVDASVVDLCHSRGYVCLYHYGCTTAVCQVNDTDLHAALSQLYMRLEEMKFALQQQLDPGNISRTCQDVVDDVVAAWRLVDHRQGVLGHWRVGISNALDGSEDSAITREALEFWREADMHAVRAQAIAEVNSLVDAEDIKSFDEWRRLVRHPDDTGIVTEEGAELEGEMEAGEAAWEDEHEKKAMEQVDEAAFEAVEAEPVGPVVQAQPGDDAASVVEATAAVKRLALLKRLRSLAIESRVPSAAFSVAREVDQLERGIHAGGSTKRRKVNHVLRREMDKQFAEEHSKVRAAQTRAIQVRRDAAKVKEAKARAKAAAEKAKADAKELEAKLAELPKTISADDAAQPGAKGIKARSDALERVMCRAPELPLELKVEWPAIRDKFAEYVPKQFKWPGGGGEKAAGVDFVRSINIVLEQLGVHYKGRTLWNKPGSTKGDPEAFTNLVRRMQDVTRHPVSATF